MQPPEIGDLIIRYLDPSSMFNLISASSAALRIFTTNDIIYLNVAINAMPAAIQPWAKTLLEATQKDICKDSSRDCKNPEFCWLHTDGLPNFKASFLKMFTMSPRSQDPKKFLLKSRNGLKALKRLATIEESVEILVKSDIWCRVPCRHQNVIFKYQKPGLPQQLLRVHLWRFELYRVLFYDTSKARMCDPFVELDAKPGQPSNDVNSEPAKHARRIRRDIAVDLGDCMQREEYLEFRKTFHSLSRFVKHFYENDLILDFQDTYNYILKKYGHLPDSKYWNNYEFGLRVLRGTRARFRNFVDYQLSLGVSYLAYIVRHETDTDLAHNNMLFFSPSSRRHRNTNFMVRDILNKSRWGPHSEGDDGKVEVFALGSLGKESEGYSLRLTIADEPYWHGNACLRTIFFDEVAFPGVSGLTRLGCCDYASPNPSSVQYSGEEIGELMDATAGQNPILDTSGSEWSYNSTIDMALI